MIVHRKDNGKKTEDNGKINYLKDLINGIHRKATEKTRKKYFFHKIAFPQKTNPGIVSMIVHRKNITIQKSKLGHLFSIENQFHKNLSQRSHQWVRQGRY